MVSVQYFSSLSPYFLAVVMDFLLVGSRSKKSLQHLYLRQRSLCQIVFECIQKISLRVYDEQTISN